MPWSYWSSWPAPRLSRALPTCPSATSPVVIELPAEYTAGRIGVDYSPEQIESSLREIGCSVERTESGYLVAVPSWRPDLRAKEDLTEEIARIDGYVNIPSTLPVAPAGRGYTPEQGRQAPRPERAGRSRPDRGLRLPLRVG